MAEKYKDAMSEAKIARINEQLDSRYGIVLETSSASHLEIVREHYLAKRDFLLTKHGLAESLSRGDYAKAVLISEAAGLMLREIAPKRLKPRERPRKDRK